VSEEEDPPQDSGKSATQLGALSVPELLARCLQGLGRPLRVRIVQTLESRAGLEVNNRSITVHSIHLQSLFYLSSGAVCDERPVGVL